MAKIPKTLQYVRSIDPKAGATILTRLASDVGRILQENTISRRGMDGLVEGLERAHADLKIDWLKVINLFLEDITDKCSQPN